MNALDPLLLLELKKPAPKVNWVLELDHPTEGTIRMSTEGLGSLSLGPYPSLLASLGDLSLALSSWRNSLSAPTLSAEFWDVAGFWTLTYGVDLRGAAVRGKLMGPDLPATAYWTWFEGVVDKISQSDPTKLSVSMRMNDDTLAAPVPLAEIALRSMPDIPSTSDLIGKGIPYAVGNHDSSGLDALGFWKLLYMGSVDSTLFAPATVAYRYLVAIGWWPAAVRVFQAGVEIVSPGDWVPTYSLTADGRKVTFVDVKTDTAGAVLLADVQDTTSATGPAACWQRLGTDIIWNDYHTDAAALATAPINTASMTALDVMLASHGLGRSYFISPERAAGNATIKEFISSYDASAYWGGDGDLRFLCWELRYQNDQLYLGPGSEDGTLALHQVLRPQEQESTLTYDADPESAITRITGKSGRREHDGAWINQRSVVVSRGGSLERVRTLELPWLPATAESVGNLETLISQTDSAVSQFTPVGAASIGAALATGPPPGTESASVYAESATATAVGGGTATFDISLSNMPAIVAVATAGVWINYSTNGLADTADLDEIGAGWVIAATYYPGTAVVGPSGPKRVLMKLDTTNPNTGLGWTQSDLSGASIRVTWFPSPGVTDGNKTVRIHQAYAAVSYTAAANVSPSLLTVLSRLANRYRVPPRIFKLDAPARFLDYDIGDDIPIEDPRKGWGQKPWERGRLRLVGKKIKPSKRDRCELTLEDVRGQLTTFWLLGRALGGIDTASAAGDGMALVTHGGVVSCTRDSVKYLDSPAGIDVQNAGPVVQILANCWPSERYGTLIERLRVNSLKRSSFVSSGTGLTESAGSGVISYSTTIGEQLYLSDTVTAQHLLITAGSPHSTQSRVTWPVTAALTSGGKFVVSIDYKGSSVTAADGLSWRLVKTFDATFWNDSTGAWQAGAVDNALIESLSWKRSESKPVTVGVDATRTFTFSVSLPAGGTAARTIRVGHVQLEEGEWRTSRIVTDAATASRAADQITVANDKDGYFLWPNSRGSWTWTVQPNWSSSNVTAGTRFYLSRLPYSNGNRWELYYLAGTGFVFNARSGGTDVTATASVTIVAGTQYTVRVRYSSAILTTGENDLPSTLTMTVDDGTTVTRADSATYTTPVYAAGVSFELGYTSGAANQQIDGYLIETRQTPYVMTDAEMGV